MSCGPPPATPDRGSSSSTTPCEELRSTLTHWTRPARSGRTGLLIQPDLQLDADIFTTRLPRQLASALRPGRGFIVTGGELDLAQLARA